MTDAPTPGFWLRLTALAATAATLLAVVSGAAGLDTAHRALAALAVPPLAALVVAARLAHRRLLAPSLAALLFFGIAATVMPRPLHIAFAALAFGASAWATARTLTLQQSVARSGSGPARARDYLTLTKPRIMSLLLLTGAAGAFAGAHGRPSLATVALTLGGLALACGGASALNHVLDRDIDRLMGSRTRERPVAAARVPASRALEFGLALSAFSFVLLASLANVLAALLALAGNLFYVLVYTRWLKRSTPQNIVIGGAAGAVPPLVGWAVATGHLGLAAVVLFGLVFLWTPPHFWALALLIERDYAAARIPMLPVVRGTRETTRQIVLYSLALVAFSLLPLAWGQFGIAYAAAAVVLGATLLLLALALRRDPTRRRAGLLFHYSLLYLALLFVAVGLDPLIG
jgi:protoheme IX farnesyltransferase